MNKSWELIEINPYQDKRGALKKIIKKSELSVAIEEIYLLYSNKGSVRGNHYHEKTFEYFIVVKGRAKVAVKEVSGDDVKVFHLTAEDNLVLRVDPYIAHAFVNEDDEELIILVVSTKEYSEDDKDTVQQEIL